MARGMAYKMRGNLGKHHPRPVPEGLDWDAWVGPAEMVEYSSFQHHRWYWISNFASGDIANQTVARHRQDPLGPGPGHPSRSRSCRWATAILPGEDDDADTPNTQAFLCKWAGHKVLVTFEIRHWYHQQRSRTCATSTPSWPRTQCVGEIFFGSKGYMIFPDYSSYYTFLGPNNEPGPFKTEGPNDAAKGYGGTFWRVGKRPAFPAIGCQAIRSRRHEDLNADVEQGHLSMTVCHLAKISCKLGRSVHFDPQTERFVNDPEADKFLKRTDYRKTYVIPEEV